MADAMGAGSVICDVRHNRTAQSHGTIARMKTRSSIILLCMGILSFLRIDGMAATTNKLDEVAKLPFGLKVVHTPDKVRAKHDGRSGRAFTWSYKTSVTAT